MWKKYMSWEIIWRMPCGENDLVLAYGSAEIIDEKFIRRYHFEYHMQAIWLAPQNALLKGFHEKEAELL